jgi:hypothetical protein
MKEEELFYKAIGIINCALDDAKKAGKISGYTRDSVRCFMQKIEKLDDVLNLSTNETYGYKVLFKESEA